MGLCIMFDVIIQKYVVQSLDLRERFVKNLLDIRERLLSPFHDGCKYLHTSCFSFKGKIQPLVGLLVLREGLLTNIQFERIMFNSPLVFKGKVTFNLLRLRKGSEVF